MNTTKNNYAIGKEMIHGSDFTVKAVKTFKGMEGCGINANLYFKNKKIRDVVDSGNGGPLDIYYHVNGRYAPEGEAHVKSFLKTLPEFTYKDMGYDFSKSKVTRFGGEELWEELINLYLVRRDHKKDMRKVAVVQDNSVFTYKAKPADLSRTFRYNGGSKTLKEIILSKNKDAIILNELPEEEAFTLWYDTTYKKESA